MKKKKRKRTKTTPTKKSNKMPRKTSRGKKRTKELQNKKQLTKWQLILLVF